MTNRSGLPALRSPGEPEVRTGAELAGLDVPTIDAVTRLLGQVERTARAQRPIVLQSPAPAVPSPAPGHPGINVRIPGPPEPTGPADVERLPRLFTRAEVVYYCGGTMLGMGGAGWAADQFVHNGGAFVPVLGAAVVLASAFTITRQSVRNGLIEVVHGRVKPRGRR